MKALIETHLLKEIGLDRVRRSRRRLTGAGSDALVIRNAKPDDCGALERLALLDSAPEPDLPMLVVEREGMLIAALPMRGGRAIADPFVPSAHAIDLLEVRRAQLHAA